MDAHMFIILILHNSLVWLCMVMTVLYAEVITLRNRVMA